MSAWGGAEGTEGGKFISVEKARVGARHGKSCGQKRVPTAQQSHAWQVLVEPLGRGLSTQVWSCGLRRGVSHLFVSSWLGGCSCVYSMENICPLGGSIWATDCLL